MASRPRFRFDFSAGVVQVENSLEIRRWDPGTGSWGTVPVRTFDRTANPVAFDVDGQPAGAKFYAIFSTTHAYLNKNDPDAWQRQEFIYVPDPDTLAGTKKQWIGFPRIATIGDLTQHTLTLTPSPPWQLHQDAEQGLLPLRQQGESDGCGGRWLRSPRLEWRLQRYRRHRQDV